MKRKQVAKNTRDLSRKLANMDGKYQGITQKQAEELIGYLKLLDKATLELGYKSPIVMLRKLSKRKPRQSD